MRPTALLVAVLTLAGCSQVSSVAERVRLPPAAGDGAVPDVPRAPWSTSYGDMYVSELSPGRVTATYEREDGTLDGTLSGRRYTGVWVEPSSARTCATTRRGSDHWGRFEFTFNDAFDRFEGVWSYCEGDLGGSWDGTRQ